MSVDRDPTVTSSVPTAHAPFEEANAIKRRLDEAARGVGRATVRHLREMYPDALAAVTTKAERSLTNFVRDRINTITYPLVEYALCIEADRIAFMETIVDLERRIADLERGDPRP